MLAFGRVALILFASTLLVTAIARAQEASGGESEESPEPSPTPAAPATPFRVSGYVRSFYFTRQNASNNPGVRFDYAPGAPYNDNAVNQASWNTGTSLHGDYAFPGQQWTAGATYFYSNPMDGPCVVAANHARGSPCVTQVPPQTNPDDTLPGFTMSTLDEAYLAYDAYGIDATIGNQLFSSPWANPSDSRLKPAAFQGADVRYGGVSHWTFELADMIAFENRTSSQFTPQTLLTSYPAGARGFPDNIVVAGGQGIDTNGFAYARVGYDDRDLAAGGYFYAIDDLANIWWFEGKYTLRNASLTPFVALQGGVESNAGTSYLGKIQSQDIGIRIGAHVMRHVLLSVDYDAIPWRTDAVDLPKNVTCNSNYQIVTKGTTLAYFLPLNAGQCVTNSNGTTQLYYGGWASPYTDSYSTDPFFSTSVTQGLADRRAPGGSWEIELAVSSSNKRWTFLATDGWYDYGNALAPQNTSIWTLDGRYHLAAVGTGPYRGLLLRYRYAQRTQSNTTLLGGLPLFKYNRAQLEYDF